MRVNRNAGKSDKKVQSINRFLGEGTSKPLTRDDFNPRDDILIDALIASCSNHEWCMKYEKKRGLIYKFKYIVWYVILIFISPYKTVNGDSFICVTTPLNEKRMRSFYKEEEFYSFARLNTGLNDMRKRMSVLSPFTLKERISLTSDAFCFYCKHRQILKGYMHYVLEYYAIFEYLIRFHPREMISPCMYDRYSTLLSYLAHGLGIKIIGIQDGAAIDINVPYKVYCDKMYTFDQFEARTIKRFIRNEGCKYEFTGFVSYCKWDIYPKKQKFLIGIASQDWYTGMTKALLNALAGELDKDQFDLIIYPHYRETKEQYNELINKYPWLNIETMVRHSNIDLLITFYSTIVYDFWSVNKNLTVFCLQIPGFSPTYYDRTNVKVFDAPEEIANAIIQMHTGQLSKMH